MPQQLLKRGGTIALGVSEDAIKASTGKHPEDYSFKEGVVSATTTLASSVGGVVAESYARGTREGSRLSGVARRAESRASIAPSANNIHNSKRARTNLINYNSNRGLTGTAIANTAYKGISIGINSTNSSRGFINTSVNGGIVKADNTRVSIPSELN